MFLRTYGRTDWQIQSEVRGILQTSQNEAACNAFFLCLSCLFVNVSPAAQIVDLAGFEAAWNAFFLDLIQ